MIDFDVQRCTRRCAASGETLGPGAEFVSLLRNTEQGVERVDFQYEKWSSDQANAPEVIAWWRSRMPKADAGAKLAPNEVLLRLFDEWGDQPERVDARYVLALLLVRRKVFRISEAPLTSSEGAAAELLRIDCPGRDESYELPAAAPGADRIAALQAELNQLLYSDAA